MLTRHVAEPRDLDEVVALEEVAWPIGMRAGRESLASRIANGFMRIAREDGRLVGLVTSFRPKWIRAQTVARLLHAFPAELMVEEAARRWREVVEVFGFARDWHEATGDGRLGGGAMHDPAGDVVFGVGITTDPRVRGRGVAKSLLLEVTRQAAFSGARFFAAYGRLPQFHAHRPSLDDYLAMLDRDRKLDVGHRLHTSVGARPATTRCGLSRYLGIPNAMHHDPESRNAGFLVTTPL